MGNESLEEIKATLLDITEFEMTTSHQCGKEELLKV